MKRSLLFLGLLLLVAAAMVFPKDFWKTKPYTRWSDKDARQLITKSPWTYEFQYGRIGDIGHAITSRDDTAGEREYLTIIRLCLFSARPVREALAVLSSGGDRQKLEKLHGFISKPSNDRIVVAWLLDSRPKGVSGLFQLNGDLMSLSLADLKNNTFLASNTGKKVYIEDYRPPSAQGNPAMFVFPRQTADGQPLLTRGDKTLRFQTKEFQLGDDMVAVDATFKVKHMLYHDQLTY